VANLRSFCKQARNSEFPGASAGFPTNFSGPGQLPGDGELELLDAEFPLTPRKSSRPPLWQVHPIVAPRTLIYGLIQTSRTEAPQEVWSQLTPVFWPTEFDETLRLTGIAEEVLTDLRTFDGSSKERDHKKLGEHIAHSCNGPWRGFKLENWEGGHRVPFKRTRHVECR